MVRLLPPVWESRQGAGAQAHQNLWGIVYLTNPTARTKILMIASHVGGEGESAMAIPPSKEPLSLESRNAQTLAQILAELKRIAQALEEIGRTIRDSKQAK